jgi:hypothetical protein
MASLGYRRGGWELYYRDPAGRQRVERVPRPGGPKAACSSGRAAGPGRTTAAVAGVRRPGTTGHDLRRVLRAVGGVSTDLEDEAAHRRRPSPAARAAVLGGWPVGDIRPTDIDGWVAQLSRRMGPWSVRVFYSLLRGPLRRAVKDQVITDLCIDIVLPRSRRSARPPTMCTAVEVDRLVAALADVGEKYANLRTNGRYAALVFAGARLGPRWNEAIGLRICDVDLARREVTFGRVVVNQNDSKPFPERGSTTDDWRTVPAPTPVIDALARHIERCVTTPRIGTRSCSPLGTGPIRCGRTSPASCVKLPTATACVAGGSPG